jgi:hypothetical protein
MSKTIRRLPRGYFRSPRGRCQALINEVRNSAIPPCSWDDIPYSDHICGWKLAEKMLKEGCQPETVAKKLMRKFRSLSYSRSYYEVVKTAMKWIK